ncbi:MAG: T9SS type A sorting domain-containing protein [candidate division KSB1 bacterium]|nr:T9SS type A sorting domain-containing protein [candidate division KSB1 bacterium]
MLSWCGARAMHVAGTFLVLASASAQQLPTIQWRQWEVVDSALACPIHMHMAIDSVGRVHIVALEDPENDDFYQDVLFHWWQDSTGWQKQMLFRHQTVRVTGIGFDFDDAGTLHLVLGVSDERWPFYGFFQSIWHMVYEGGAWTEMHCIQRAPEGQGLCMATLPNRRVAIAWWEGYALQSTIFWKLWEKGRWGSTLVGIKRFSPKENGCSQEPSLARGRGDTLELAFVGEPRGETWYPALFYAFRAVKGEWSSPSELYFNPQHYYMWPLVAVTRDGCRHVFWGVDYDKHEWPDQLVYSFSRDGRSWAGPLALSAHPFTRLPLHIPGHLKVVADSSGLLHALWDYIAWPKEGLHYYRYGRERTWSEVLTPFGEEANSFSFDLGVDRFNRIHFVWVSALEPSSGMKIMHAVAELVRGANVPGVPAAPVRARPLLLGVAAYPNPFNVSVTFSLHVAERCAAVLTIYDLQGRLVRILTEKAGEEGVFTMKWDGVNTSGLAAPSGIYLFRVLAQTAERQEVITGRLFLVR